MKIMKIYLFHTRIIKIKKFIEFQGRIKNKTNDKTVKACEGTGGRMSVTLYNDNKKYGRRLHNLVANAFVPNPDQKEYVYNANCDLRNCRADNLFWISGQECNQLFSQQMVRREMLQELKGYHRLVVASNR